MSNIDKTPIRTYPLKNSLPTSNQFRDYVLPCVFLVRDGDFVKEAWYCDENKNLYAFQIGGGSGGDFIPITGTEINKPVTGNFDIESDTDFFITKTRGTNSAYYRISDEPVLEMKVSSTDFSNNTGFFTDGRVANIAYTDDSGQLSLSLGIVNGIVVSDTINNKGIDAEDYYGDNYTDTTYVQKKYVDDSIGNFIPMSGTEEGKPLTGSIVTEQEFPVLNFKTDEFNNYVFLGESGVVLAEEDVLGGTGVTMLNVGSSAAQISSDNPLSRGIVGIQDYSDNITELCYPQKIYVDSQHSYSTTEIKTGGTWIDGKSIYRVVITFSLPSNEYTLNHNLNIDTYLPCFRTLLNSNQYISLAANEGSSSDNIGDINLNSDNIHFENIDLLEGDISLILEYTKNID